VTKILVMNGPNLNLLGIREPGVYGNDTLPKIEKRLQDIAEEKNIEIDFFQSNSEGGLVERVHKAYEEKVDYIVINPGGYTHTSVALRDAFSATKIPFIEIHISNIHKREDFRHKSYFSDIAEGVICGLGTVGYELALRAAIEKA